MKRNPKQIDSNLFDCIPQTGNCPMNCNQCFYNRNEFYLDKVAPNIPTVEEVGNGIVRMNCGHDSNINRNLVIETAKRYKHFFFNTSIPDFDFPAPVVFTANPKEEEYPYTLDTLPGWWDVDKHLENLMFIRLRVSPTNLDKIKWAIPFWVEIHIPIVLTFMAYYDMMPPGVNNKLEYDINNKIIKAYEWKVRHINSYYCPTTEFMFYVLDIMKNINSRLVTMCGTLNSVYCKDCKNCESYYWQTMKRLKGN